MILCRFQGFPDFVTSVNIFQTKEVLEEDPLSKSCEKTCRAFCSNVVVTGLGGGNRSWGDDGGHHHLIYYFWHYFFYLGVEMHFACWMSCLQSFIISARGRACLPLLPKEHGQVFYSGPGTALLSCCFCRDRCRCLPTGRCWAAAAARSGGAASHRLSSDGGNRRFSCRRCCASGSPSPGLKAWHHRVEAAGSTETHRRSLAGKNAPGDTAVPPKLTGGRAHPAFNRKRGQILPRQFTFVTFNKWEGESSTRLSYCVDHCGYYRQP